MAKAEDIKWGSYKSFEGPFYRGTQKYRLPGEPTEDDRILAVITATEGGRWDAYNGYDVCICTSGLIQWCNRAPQHSVDSVLGKVAASNSTLILPMKTHAASCGYDFRPNSRGQWRYFDMDGGEIDTKSLQRKLFFLNSTGKKGSWDDASREHSKRWAAAISTVWESRSAQKIQALYTTKRLRSFVVAASKTLFNAAPPSPVGRAFQAMYLSFAANNPKWAGKSLRAAMDSSTTMPAWTVSWLAMVVKHMTFHSKISIYPHRYNAIRPVIEKLYGIDLPDYADELKQWQSQTGFKYFLSTKKLQEGLLSLDYDLGPWKADGKYGDKTKEALKQFEIDSGVPEEHQDGMIDEHTYPKLEAELERRGALQLEE